MKYDLVLQFTAAAMLLWGLWRMGDKVPSAPLIAGLSEVLWVVVGVRHGLWGLVFLSVVLMGIQFRNFLAWRAP